MKLIFVYNFSLLTNVTYSQTKIIINTRIINIIQRLPKVCI